VSLPYKSSMQATIILPRDNSKIPSIIDSFKSDSELKFPSLFKSQKVTLSFPKFKLEYETSLPDILKELGLNRAFTPQAQFSKISEVPLFISNVIHKTVLEVDEKGTEAAAATVVEMSRCLAVHHETIHEMNVNHPFFIVLRDATSNLVLFTGFVASPL